MVVVVNGDGGRERTPLSKANGGGIRYAVIRSPAVVVARSQDPTSASAANTADLIFFPPELSLVHPALAEGYGLHVLPSEAISLQD